MPKSNYGQRIYVHSWMMRGEFLHGQYQILKDDTSNIGMERMPNLSWMVYCLRCLWKYRTLPTNFWDISSVVHVPVTEYAHGPHRIFSLIRLWQLSRNSIPLIILFVPPGLSQYTAAIRYAPLHSFGTLPIHARPSGKTCALPGDSEKVSAVKSTADQKSSGRTTVSTNGERETKNRPR